MSLAEMFARDFSEKKTDCGQMEGQVQSGLNSLGEWTGSSGDFRGLRITGSGCGSSSSGRPVGTGRRRAAAHHSKPSCVCRCRKRGEPQGGGRGKRNEPEEGAVPLGSSAPWLPAVSHEHSVTRGQGALAPAPSEPGPTEGEQLRSGDSAAALCGQRSPRTRLGPGSAGKPRSPQEYQLHFSKAFFS